MSTAIKHIEKILSSEFKMDNYVDLVREIFSTVKIIAPDTIKQEYSNFSSHVAGYAHVGNYETPDSEKIAVFAVELKQQTYVENSRSTQRSYAKKLIENGGCDAALIAFYTPNDPDKKWRLSFVVLDYEMKIENGKMKTEEKITPAKRYSYLVGVKEPCHTAISRFGKFIRDNESQPTLAEMEEAFSVEAVTKEFFDLYCEKFYQLVDYLESNEAFKGESDRCGFSTEQFAKKLMGQIVFLYFLQKKGWLGVPVWPNKLSEKEYKDVYYTTRFSSAQKAQIQKYLPLVYVPFEDGYRLKGFSALESIPDDVEENMANAMPGDRKWGSGSKTFLRTWFEWSAKHNGKFYDDYLEPLFYATLNRNRGELGYSTILHCRVPFLSGGLFDPIDGYDWEHVYFDIPDEIFSNKKTENDLTADGILDIFDRYNFTMSEDEPMEREVAIDPEMLGKVFENLLDVENRKSKGAFYTPREIVHYMCQESLVNYLSTNMDISEDAIRSFILYGDFYKDSDTEKTKRVVDENGNSHYEFDDNRELKISPEIFSPKDDVNRINEIDELLKNIRVADPAVGSGAFPLGMLNEIVRARQNLSAYMATQMSAYNARIMFVNERSAHTLKYETIRNCLFAADIEPSAVDIAQLRLWLALVIDDEINPEAQSFLDGHRNPLPLPNLECNIVCGNSLVDEFKGIKLVPQSDTLNTNEVGREYSLFQSELDVLIPKFIEVQDKLFGCDDTAKKQQYLDEIKAVKDQIIHIQLDRMSSDVRDAYEQSKTKASKPYVLWQVEFARVFKEKGGFDVVIGNPPYVQLQKLINEETGEKLGDKYEKMNFESFAKKGDIYCLFYEKGYHLLHNSGVLSYITSNKWMRAGYGEKLRGFFANKTNPICLVDFAGQKVFESATVDVNILMFKKEKNDGNTLACVIRDKCVSNLSVYIMQNSSKMQFESSNAWSILSEIEQNIRDKINTVGVPLSQWDIQIYRGILTGYNEAFIIDSETKDTLISLDSNSAELIRPILRGRDIQRFAYNFSDQWLISTFPSKNYDIEQYPAIKDYLLSFGINRLEQTGKQYIVDGKKIKSRKKTNNKWFETQDSISYWNDLCAQKIIWGEISDKPKFAIDIEGKYTPEATTFMMTGKNLKYLLCFLNSTLSEYYFAKIGTTTGMGTLRWKKYLIETLPVPKADDISTREFDTLVDSILSDYDNKDLYINAINEKIYKAFDFTDEEIMFIEEMVKMGAH
ncbi:MAG: Eco57I restriction-modification methylase domain-containing protein [Clostridium sp.]|nr:Eco57I restriction-modification methylase domain-containing protein [Clostridium sp.]